MKPIEVSNQDFPTQLLNGYSRQAVRMFLARVADEMEQMQSRVQTAVQQVDHLKQSAGKSMLEENAIARAMMDAEHMALRVRSEADEEARVTREAAVRDAERVRSAAQTEAERVLTESKAELVRVQNALMQLRRALVDNAEQAIGQMTAATAIAKQARDLGAGLPIGGDTDEADAMDSVSFEAPDRA